MRVPLLATSEIGDTFGLALLVVKRLATIRGKQCEFEVVRPIVSLRAVARGPLHCSRLIAYRPNEASSADLE